MPRRSPKKCKHITVEELMSWYEDATDIWQAVVLLEPLASKELIDAAGKLGADLKAALEREYKK